MIITVLTVHSTGTQKALDLLRWINELGGVNLRTIVIAATSGADGKALVEEARRGWGKVEYLRIQTPEEIMPWPQGNNLTFLQVCRYMQRHSQPFFFMEPDVLPLRAGWFDELEVEYSGAGRAFMGVIRPLLDRDGRTIPGSEHMNGSGVYPPNVLAHLPTAQYLENTLIGQAFDIVLRFEMLGQHDGNGGFKTDRAGARLSNCANSERICLCWKSTNYHLDADGEPFCDTDPARGYSRLDFSRHVLHHGCKDDSLLKLLRARLTPPGGEATVAPASNSRIEEPPNTSPPGPSAPQKTSPPAVQKRTRGRQAKKKRRPRSKPVPATTE